MRHAVALVALALLLLPTAPADEPAALRLVLLGDTGTGGEGQRQVAAAVQAVCAARGCDLALVAGDNIYDSGVGSAYDPQFEAKFEEPYAGLDLPFYLALGNHDNGGAFLEGDGSHHYRGDFQVAYHYRTDRASDKWHLPARYHTVRVGDVQLWALDTNTLMWWGGLPVPGEPVWTGFDPLGRAQLQWFQDSVAASDARWKLAFAHHPYISNGQHGDAGSYEGVPTLGFHVQRFVEEAVCGAVDFYVAGHDHDLQWLKPVESCGRTEFLVSGAGAKSRPLAGEEHPFFFQRGETLGFAWLELQGDRFTGAYHDGTGALLYERTGAKA